MIPRLLSRLWWRRYLARNARPWDELERFPALSPAEQRRELAARLLAQVRYFGSRPDALPEWREVARIQDPADLWRVWPSLPILDKAKLQACFPAAEMQARFGIQGRRDSTGGSTGEPVHFFHDTPMLRSGLAAATYTAVRMGWQPGMPVIILWGSERDIRKRMRRRDRLHGWLRNEFLLDAYRMSEGTVQRALSIIHAHAPVAIYGFTSILEHVARRLVESGRCPAPGLVRTAWNGGEMLFAEQSRIFRQAFGVPILNRYGGRELSAMACQFVPDGPLEVLRPWLFVEIVDENGRPAPPGQTGRLLWTSTICRGTPFLRYDIGDLGVALPAHQNESGVFAIHQIEGRVAGLLQLPDGSKINNIFWNHLFKEFSEIRQFQVVLRRDGSIDLRLKGNALAPERDQRLRETLAHFLGSIPFRFCWVDQIPLTAQGKLVQVVRE